MATFSAIFAIRFALGLLACLSESWFIDGEAIKTGLSWTVVTFLMIVVGWYTIADKSLSLAVACSLASKDLSSAIIAHRRKQNGAAD